MAVGLLTLAMPAGGAMDAPTAPTAQPVHSLTCASVTPHTWNRRVRLGRTITGRPHFSHRVKQPVCTTRYRTLGVKVRHARHQCVARASTVGASYYGGPNDPSSGSGGAWGSLPGRHAFATLRSGGLMSIPPRAFRFVHHIVQTLKMQKLDWGSGGGPVQGYERAIDLYFDTLPLLGLSDNGVVQVSVRNCWAR